MLPEYVVASLCELPSFGECMVLIDDFSQKPKSCVEGVFWRAALAGGRLEQVLGKVTLTFANERILRTAEEKVQDLSSCLQTRTCDMVDFHI